MVRRGRNYSDSYDSEKDSSTNSWRSYTQNSYEETVKKVRNSKRWMERRNKEAKYRPGKPKPKEPKNQGRGKSREQKNARQRNSTSSASPTTSNTSESTPEQQPNKTFDRDRGRSQSKFREESKSQFDIRKERLRRREEEAIRREFKKRKGYKISSDEEDSNSSDDDQDVSHSYDTSGSQSQSQEPDIRNNPKLRRFDTRDHRWENKPETQSSDETPDKRHQSRKRTSSSEQSSSEERNPFMRLSQLQRQRDEKDPSRVGYRGGDDYYGKMERADADDFLKNRRRLGDAEYYCEPEFDPNRRYRIRTQEPEVAACQCVIS